MIGAFDQLLDRRRRLGWQPEADVDGVLETIFKNLVVDAERRFERLHHIADHVLVCVVQQSSDPLSRLHVRLDVSDDLFDDDRVLGDREAVLTQRLAVPTGHAG